MYLLDQLTNTVVKRYVDLRTQRDSLETDLSTIRQSIQEEMLIKYLHNQIDDTRFRVFFDEHMSRLAPFILCAVFISRTLQNRYFPVLRRTITLFQVYDDDDHVFLLVSTGEIIEQIAPKDTGTSGDISGHIKEERTAASLDSFLYEHTGMRFLISVCCLCKTMDEIKQSYWKLIRGILSDDYGGRTTGLFDIHEQESLQKAVAGGTVFRKNCWICVSRIMKRKHRKIFAWNPSSVMSTDIFMT